MCVPAPPGIFFRFFFREENGRGERRTGNFAAGMPPREYGPATGLNSNQAYKADPIGKVQAQVDQVKITMRENVEVMVTNMERTAQLEDKSAALATQARAFHSTSKATRRHMWCQLLKQRMLLGGVCLTIVIILILWIAGSMGAFNN